MSALNQATCRRLLKLPQIPSVWEGDRRRLGRDRAGPELGSESEGDCILWVDGSQGIVRAMDVVSPDTGHESVVRTLLRAIEYPHDPATPARPQKIVVSNREIQFYLRGVLQDLGITLEYVPELPVIEEIFRSLEQAMVNRPPMLPSRYAESLQAQALQLWELAPWEVLSDHQILAVTVNHWDLESVYVSVMGMLGMEFGVLLYRSLDSLKQFRQRVLAANDSMGNMEEAFLGQDCLFLTYEAETADGVELPQEEGQPKLQPVFGTLHPLEGMRSFLYEEEVVAFSAVLEALSRFIKAHRSKFELDQFPTVSGRYKVSTLDGDSVSLKVQTLPELADELYSLAEDAEGESLPLIRDDLIPEQSFLSLGVITWEMLTQLRSQVSYYQPNQPIEAGDGLPVVVIQTSQPKAKTLIQELLNMGGLAGIGFNPGEDSLLGERYDIGLLQTGNSDLHLFGEFLSDDPMHQSARKKWDQRCKKTKGYCGLVIAKGVKGASRGNPKLVDMLALFEARSISPQELGMGILEKQPVLDWDVEF